VDGTFWQFKDVAMEPKPVQQPYPPLWFGARQAPALKRAVQYGNGWMGAGSSSTEDFIEQYGMVRQFLDEARRDPATFAISKRVYIAVDNDRARAERRLRAWFGVRYRSADMGSRVGVWGSRDECLDRLAAIVRAGAQHLLLNPMFDDMEHLELLAQEIVPHL
jgi:alkanesulfonate monooxygenase SsuD/methylene tetrahydromethanopterin reductase-like flavin-dependent oxidoreductase (luciferase family)